MPSDGASEMPEPIESPNGPEGDELNPAGSGRVEMRQLRFSDLPSILEIERASFGAPWSLAMFVSELSRGESICLAATIEGEIAGYLVCSRYDRVWHLNNIAVSPPFRSRGIGRLLLETMLEKTGGLDEVTLEVRASNRGAMSLYHEHGFRAAGRRPRYYPDNREDALIMTRPAQVRAGAAAGRRHGGDRA